MIPITIEHNNYFSNIFTSERSGGLFRMILKLKSLNESTIASHFKMDSTHNVVYMVQPILRMASADLKNAFYPSPCFEDQKYLKFTIHTSLQLCRIDIQMPLG